MGIMDILQLFSSVSLLGILLFLLVLYFISSNSNEKEPPGPRPLPVVGNLLQIELNRLHLSLWEVMYHFHISLVLYRAAGLNVDWVQLSRKYGSVFTVHLGPNKAVVLSGYKTVKEALVNNAEVFGDRAPTQEVKDTFKGHGVTWSNGDTWKEMRRFTLTNLRDFGMGKKACEDKIIEECGYLLEVIHKFKGKPFDTAQPLNNAVSNIICSMVYGNRFQYDDSTFTTMVAQINVRFELGSSPSVQLYDMFPWAGRWIRNREKLIAILNFLKKQHLALFSRLRETLNPQMCRGLVDAFMVKQMHLKESGVADSHYTDENLLGTVMNLFAAGTETTSTTLRWGLLLMAKYQNIQDQVRKEITRVIGGRQVQVKDRKDLPFTDAVIHETQRFGNIAPLALPHKTTQDITFQGHFIKKGTTVFPLLTSVLCDEAEWEKPHSFYPAHFLDKDGMFVKRDAFMPFSAGRRICVGEGLTRMELFLFFATLIQHFQFTAPPGVTEEDLDITPISGVSQSPLPHKLCALSCV